MNKETKEEAEILNSIDLDNLEAEPVNIEPEVKILMTDPKWTDFVISHLDETELIKGNPKVDGLRRVAQILLGPIYESKSELIQFGETTIAKHTVVIGWKEDGPNLGQREYIYSRRIFTDIACVNAKNTPEAYLIHMPESAASKAEGRALRKALNIKKLAAEELFKPEDIVPTHEAVVNPEEQELGDVNLNKPIDNTQLSAINILVKRLDLSLDSICKKLGFEQDKLTFTNGQEMFKTISDWQKNKESIPEEVKNKK